jgi:putative transposase
MPTRSSTRRTRQTYEFIKANTRTYDVTIMCRTLGLIRSSLIASHGIYATRRVFLNLREAGETCSKHRVGRLMRVNSIRACRYAADQSLHRLLLCCR